MVWPFVLLLFSSDSTLATAAADSIQAQATILADQGELDAALELVTQGESSLPPAEAGLLAGRFTLDGELARKGYETAAMDSSALEETRGEALLRLGQYYYAVGAYNFAIPQFREYLRQIPDGAFADPAAYWMGYACLQYAQRPQHVAYRDTGLIYVDAALTRISSADSNAGDLSELKARLLSAQGDTTAALKILEVARRRVAVAATPGIWFLSAWLERDADPDASRQDADTLNRRFPTAPEIHLLTRTQAHHGDAGWEHSKPKGSSSPKAVIVDSTVLPHFTLQLGAFSHTENAEQLRRRLAARGMHARTLHSGAADKSIYRVLYGDFKDAAEAKREGDRIFSPWGYVFQIVPSP